MKECFKISFEIHVFFLPPMVVRNKIEPRQEIRKTQVESIILNQILSIMLDQGTHTWKTPLVCQEEGRVAIF